MTNGKNLVNISSKTGTQTNDYYVIFGESQEIADIFNHNIGETFSFGCKLSDPNFLQELAVYYTDFTSKTVRNTITIEKFVRKVEVRARSNNSAYNGTNVEMSDLQLEYGSTPTQYEPYKEPVTTNIYLDEPLRKTGDYADVLNFREQSITRKIGKIVFNGTENWEITESTAPDKWNRYSICVLCSNMDKTSPTNAIICDSYIVNTTTVNSNTNISSARKSNGNNRFWFYINFAELTGEKTTDTTEILNAWKQKLSENPVTAWYILADETEESIDLPEIPTFKGTTVITTDTEVQPSNMEITYKARR